MRANELAKLLAAQCERVVMHLLPNGKRAGTEWCVGSVDGEPGKSMRVHLSGDKAGVWLDGATSQVGDLIGLWIATRKCSLHEACRDASEFLGIRDDQQSFPAKVYSRPSRDGVSALSAVHLDWLTNTRKLPIDSIRAYRIASQGDWIVFPFLVDGEPIFAKYRKPPKVFRADANCEPILFGWQAIAPDVRAVVICEGELDAIAWHAYGFPALSMPNGAGSLNWIEGSDYDRLVHFDEILLSTDMDAAGQMHVAEICERLGLERTRVVRLAAKDANQCLLDGVSRDVMAQAIRAARTLDPSELRTAHEFEEEIIAEFARRDHGLTLPWRTKSDGILLRAGEVSIWPGINGHGKSEVVGHVVGFQAAQGTRCCIASMEFAAPRWLKRLYRQIAGTAVPTQQFLRHISAQMRDVLWVFDVSGTAKADRILRVFEYARRRYAIALFVIDNLAKCGFDEDDYTGQKKFVDQLTDFARTTGAHVIVVAHMRKGDNEDAPAGKMGIKGTGAIADMCDTIIEVWRNKPRERAKRKAADESRITGAPAPLNEKLAAQGDTLLLCHKQRNGESEPRFWLYFDPASHQFLGAEKHTARAMIEFRGQPEVRELAA